MTPHEQDMEQLVDRLRKRLERWALDWVEQAREISDLKRGLTNAEAAIERVRRVAQVWVDIRPTYPTATREGHAMADAGQKILDALDADQ